MNPGQEKFLSFILERVREEEMVNAKELLLDNFTKQGKAPLACRIWFIHRRSKRGNKSSCFTNETLSWNKKEKTQC